MAFLDLKTRSYRLKTALSKSTILGSLQQRITHAKEETSWFSLSNITINYKRMSLDEDHLIIDREGITVNKYAGKGTIDVYFSEGDNNTTIVQAKITPFVLVPMLWFVAVAALVFGAVLFSYDTSWHTALITLVVWAGMAGAARISTVLNRYRLESNLSSVLTDIGIDEEPEECE